MDMSRVYHVCMDECEVANSDVNGNCHIRGKYISSA